MKWIVFAALIFVTTGCTVVTKPVHLQLPESDRISGDLKPVVIETISDSRNFSVSETGSPKLSTDTVKQLGDENLRDSIGGLSHGKWAYVTSGNGTVTNVVESLIIQSLSELGYRVIDKSQAPTGTPVIGVNVQEFWATMPFNFGRALTWTQQLKAWIRTDVNVNANGIRRDFIVSGYGANIIQVLSEENVQETYLIAMKDYQRNLSVKLSTALR